MGVDADNTPARFFDLEHRVTLDSLLKSPIPVVQRNVDFDYLVIAESDSNGWHCALSSLGRSEMTNSLESSIRNPKKQKSGLKCLKLYLRLA